MVLSIKEDVKVDKLFLNQRNLLFVIFDKNLKNQNIEILTY